MLAIATHFYFGYSIILQFPLTQPVKLFRGIFWSNISSLYQKSLYNAHITTSKLCESVRAKRAELQWLRQNVKLISILKEQVRYNCLDPIIQALCFSLCLHFSIYANFTGVPFNFSYNICNNLNSKMWHSLF